MSVSVTLLRKERGWNAAKNVNNEGPVRQLGVCNNRREDDRPDGCLLDPILHECLGDNAVRLPDGACYDPRGLASWWERSRSNPTTRAAFSDADEAAVRQLAGLALGPQAQDVLDEALMDAAYRGDNAQVAHHLAAGANIHSHYDRALVMASTNGHASVVAQLLAAGADVHSCNDYALCRASHFGHTSVVALLLAAGANVHANNDNALHLASYSGHTSVVAQLLTAGADVHAADDRALRAALDRGHNFAVELLLAAGANVHALDNAALQLASKRGHAHVVALLQAAARVPPPKPRGSRWTQEELRVLADGARSAPGGSSRRAIARSIADGGLLPGRTLAAIESQLASRNAHMQ